MTGRAGAGQAFSHPRPPPAGRALLGAGRGSNRWALGASPRGGRHGSPWLGAREGAAAGRRGLLADLWASFLEARRCAGATARWQQQPQQPQPQRRQPHCSAANIAGRGHDVSVSQGISQTSALLAQACQPTKSLRVAAQAQAGARARANARTDARMCPCACAAWRPGRRPVARARTRACSPTLSCRVPGHWTIHRMWRAPRPAHVRAAAAPARPANPRLGEAHSNEGGASRARAEHCWKRTRLCGCTPGQGGCPGPGARIGGHC